MYDKAIKHDSVNITTEIMDKIKYDHHALFEWRITLEGMMKNDYKEKGKCNFFLGKFRKQHKSRKNRHK